MVIQPTRYSCFPACLSFLMDIPIHEIFEAIGHTGHDYPFSFSELQHWCLTRDYILTRFDHANDIDRFDYAMNCHSHPGILTVNKGSEYDHALVLFDGIVLDPKDGESMYLRKLKYPVTAYYMLTDL